MRKPQLQVQGEYPSNARVVDVTSREVVFTAQGDGAWKKAQDFYRAHSRRWPNEDKDTARVLRSIKSDRS
jgi:hypothetical protein